MVQLKNKADNSKSPRQMLRADSVLKDLAQTSLYIETKGLKGLIRRAQIGGSPGIYGQSVVENLKLERLGGL